MPKENNGSTPEFDEFVAAGEVEVGESNSASQEEAKPEKKPAARRGPPKSATKAEPEGDDDGGNDPEGDEPEGDDDGKPKKREPRKPSDRIRDLTRRLRESERARAASDERLIRALENGGLPKGQDNDNSAPKDTPAPDPTDTAKYPLGHLDDRYIEDKLEWLAEQKATKLADAALHRQQENEANVAAEREQQNLLDKVDDLSTRGADLYDDFHESVVETGMRGDWKLSQATFEAAHEADNGAQILYELSQDKKEAARVAGLSNYQQMKFVQERDAEITKTKTPRTKPKAGEPPQTNPRGANSRVQINPATDNLDDFEKAWEADAKKGNR